MVDVPATMDVPAMLNATALLALLFFFKPCQAVADARRRLCYASNAYKVSRLFL